MREIAELNSIEETATLFGVDEAVIRGLIDEFLLGSLTVGRRELVPRRAIEEFIENNTRPAIFANPWGLVTPTRIHPPRASGSAPTTPPTPVGRQPRRG